MNIPMGDLATEFASLHDEVDTAIRRVLERGSFVLGPELEAFETEFASYCGVKHAAGVASGTAALMLALQACDLEPGDEVLTVPNTDTPTISAITHAGGTIALVDTHPRTFNMDPERLADAISPRTKVILPVHLFGQPADIEAIAEIAHRHDAILIEDGALAVGAEYRGNKVGTFGDMGCFSFAPGKILGGAGAGGMVVTNDPSLDERIRVLRNYGHAPGLSLDPTNLLGGSGFTVLEEGHNERLDEIQAAVLRAKLPTLDDRIARRRSAATRYDRLLADIVETPPLVDDAESVWFAYNVMLDNRDAARAHLASRGVATRLYYNPLLHLQPAYSHLGLGPGSFPNAERAASRMMGLPVFPQMTDEQVDLAAAAVVEFASAI
jgi:dTDP-4-amino-4,6-dideoxygalactose transaminase